MKNHVPQPRGIVKTGDNSPATSIWGYIRRMTGGHQIAACLLAIVIAGVDIIPVDLQRRIVDEAIKNRDMQLFFMLAAIYLGVVILHKLLKFMLGVYQNWITESAVYYTRGHIYELYGDRITADADTDEAGEVVSIVVSETDKIGEFVGVALSEAATNMAMLVGVIGYMVFVDWKIAMIGIALLVPQVILTPFVQRALNKLVEKNVGLLRELGQDVAHLGRPGAAHHSATWGKIYRNRMIQSLIRNALKSGLNLLNGLAPFAVIAYGGYLVIQGQTTIGVILAFTSGFDKISEPARNLITFYRNAHQANVQHAMIARWMVRTAKIAPDPEAVEEYAEKQDQQRA